MGFIEAVKGQLRPESPIELQPGMNTIVSAYETGEVDEKAQARARKVEDQEGVATIEATQAIWGKRGKWFIMAG